MRTLVLLILLPTLLIGACDSGNSPRAIPSDSTEVTMKEKALDAAVAQARGALPAFERIVRSPQPGQTGFAVRAGFPHRDGVEHLWLLDPKFSGDTVVGIAETDGLHLPIKQGQTLAVLKSTVTDWMYFDHGKRQGGYTERVLVGQP